MNKGWGTYQSLALSSNLTKVIMRLIVDNQKHFSLPSYVETQIQQSNNKCDNNKYNHTIPINGNYNVVNKYG